MSSRLAFPILLAGALILTASLTGCSAGPLPGSGAGGGAGTGSLASSGSPSTGKPNAGTKPCTASGTTIPAGTYSGTIKSTLNTVMHLALPGGVSVPNAGSGTEAMDGNVEITSNGRTVTGSINLGGPGTSQVGDKFVIHSTTGGAFTGVISGPASSPIVTGEMDGAWVTLDAPIDSDGHSSGTTKVGLHITAVSCSGITGDAIAMFDEIAKPVAQYITLSGSGVWTATRH